MAKTNAELLQIATQVRRDILLEVGQAIAEAFNFDQDEMLRAIINNNNKELYAVRRAFKALQLAA